MNEKYQKFSQFLNQRFLDWQQQFGERLTIGKFSIWLGIPPATVNQWLNASRLPSDKYRHKLIEKFGLEVLDVLELETVEKELQQLSLTWNRITPSDREKILDMMTSMVNNYE